MKKHTCKTCGNIFEYCRGCLLSPIPHKDAGYCSKACYEESKAPKIEEVVPVEDVEVVVIEEDTSTSEEVVEYPYFFAEITEVASVDEQEIVEDNVVTTEEIKIKHKKKRNKNSYKENDINDNEQSDA